MWKIEERRDALLPMDLILACLLNMGKMGRGRGPFSYWLNTGWPVIWGN
jgi:hypothetical protein